LGVQALGGRWLLLHWLLVLLLLHWLVLLLFLLLLLLLLFMLLLLLPLAAGSCAGCTLTAARRTRGAAAAGLAGPTLRSSDEVSGSLTDCSAVVLAAMCTCTGGGAGSGWV